jgi:hypothetical protein
MVGVGKCIPGNVPGRIPIHQMFIDQQPHKLGNPNRWVGIVELYRKSFLEVV